MSRIPLVDLRWQHQQIASEVQSGWSRILENTAFIGGSEVAQFESEYAQFIGARFCVGVGNGTDAIELGLRALGIGPGDEVIVPANTFIASALAVVRAGATPVLVDSDADTHLMDVSKIASRLTPRTKAIIPVHLYGQVATLADTWGLHILEDAAQAQGAAGVGVHLAATSFYPGKNLGAYGDAGAVTSNDETLAARLRALRNYGSEVKYHHPEMGFNSRLDPLQAVVLRAKLKHLTAWNNLRRQAAEIYRRLLDGFLEGPRAVSDHVYHLYVVRVPRRDDVLARLHADGVDAGIHYPVPLHLHGALSYLGYRAGDFPVAEKAASEILSLPMYPGITAEQQERVVASLRKAVG